ncbi:hypothetical protein ILUMI_27356 [Ignelater luminosus]|uniref:Uncharacterized protein n=1 Tax=Ignelater luminosus TaxID=2038154 RepID=A0A8K0C839_IGNLU|nr:hypothetical protein ILUMI_27356 [Ignelater luminosus]
MDESGFSIVAKRCQKIITAKGSKAVRSVASGERVINITIVCCVSAAGWYATQMIISQRKKTDELGNGAPPGTKIQISDSEYISIAELLHEAYGIELKLPPIDSKRLEFSLLIDMPLRNSTLLLLRIFSNDSNATKKQFK